MSIEIVIPIITCVGLSLLILIWYLYYFQGFRKQICLYATYAVLALTFIGCMTAMNRIPKQSPVLDDIQLKKQEQIASKQTVMERVGNEGNIETAQTFSAMVRLRPEKVNQETKGKKVYWENMYFITATKFGDGQKLVFSAVPNKSISKDNTVLFIGRPGPDINNKLNGLNVSRGLFITGRINEIMQLGEKNGFPIYGVMFDLEDISAGRT